VRNGVIRICRREHISDTHRPASAEAMQRAIIILTPELIRGSEEEATTLPTSFSGGGPLG